MNRIDYAVKVVEILKDFDFDRYENYYGRLRFEQSLVSLIEVERESNSSPMRAALYIYGFFHSAFLLEKKDAIKRGTLVIH